MHNNKSNNSSEGPDLNLIYRLDPITLKFCADKKDWDHAKLIAGLIQQAFIDYKKKLESKLTAAT